MVHFRTKVVVLWRAGTVANSDCDNTEFIRSSLQIYVCVYGRNIYFGRLDKGIQVKLTDCLRLSDHIVCLTIPPHPSVTKISKRTDRQTDWSLVYSPAGCFLQFCPFFQDEKGDMGITMDGMDIDAGVTMEDLLVEYFANQVRCS